MALQGQQKFIAGNAVAVIANPQQAQTALFGLDLDPRRAGIERILDQFFDNRGRALDDFASFDLVDQRVGQ